MTKIISILISLCMILNACTTDKTTIKPNPVVTRNGQDNNPDPNSKPPTLETHNIKKQSKDNFSNESQIEDNYQDFTLKKNQQKSVNTINPSNTSTVSNPNITKDITPKTPLEKENTINKNDDSISKSSILDSISPEEESTIDKEDNDTNKTNKNDDNHDQQNQSTFSMLEVVCAGGGILGVAFLALMFFKRKTNKLLGKEEEDNGNISNRKRTKFSLSNLFNPFKNFAFAHTSPSSSTSSSSTASTTSSTDIPSTETKKSKDELIKEREAAKKKLDRRNKLYIQNDEINDKLNPMNGFKKIEDLEEKQEKIFEEIKTINGGEIGGIHSRLSNIEDQLKALGIERKYTTNLSE